MEYSPPPLFKQGASARAKVVFFALMSLALLAADSRLHALTVIRQAVGTALYPLQMLALMPRDTIYTVSDYFASLSTLEAENAKLKRQQIANAQTLQQEQHLLAENTQLRKLLGTSAQIPLKSLMGEILYDARDAFTRKLILNRGSRDGVEPGQPVIDDVGVVGQITRVFPLTSEVTLLTDKDQAIPVQVVRSGLRSVAYGRGHSGMLDLRFMAATADIRKDDLLVTSGIDGVYPAGLAVAKVLQVESKSNDAFARIVCQPMAGIDRNRQLLILLADANLPRSAVEADRHQGAEGNEQKADTPNTRKAPATAASPGVAPKVEMSSKKETSAAVSSLAAKSDPAPPATLKDGHKPLAATVNDAPRAAPARPARIPKATVNALPSAQELAR